MEKHLNLAIGARARLAYLKAYAEKHNATRKAGFDIDWRTARYANFKSDTGLDQGFNRNRVPVWYTHGNPVLSRVMFADECQNAPYHVREKSGWFADVDASETVRGVVALLPHGKAIAGYFQSSNGEYVWFPTVYNSDHDAARYDAAREADRQAEREADEQRQADYQVREAEKLQGKIEDALQRVRELIVLRHVACMAYARDELREAIENIRAWRKTLRVDFADVF